MSQLSRLAYQRVSLGEEMLGEEMSADVVVFFASSVGEEMFPPWFEPTPAVKTPSAVVHP